MTPQPDYAVPPGELIHEWIEENDVTPAEFARRLGISRDNLGELLVGTATLSHQLAVGLERATGIPARRWDQLEALYRADRTRLTIGRPTSKVPAEGRRPAVRHS